MTNRRHFCLMWILLLLGLGLSGCGGNDDDTISAQFSERTQRELETTVGQLFQELGVPGMMVGLWVPNVGKWTRAYGVSNRETGEPMHFDQHVRIGSVTKTFTVTLILQLQDAGLLNINDTLDQYFDTDPNSDKITLTQPIPNADRITLKNLANMTSGLASYTFDPVFQDAFFGNPQLTMATAGSGQYRHRQHRCRLPVCAAGLLRTGHRLVLQQHQHGDARFGG
ncbi:MAG: beta-lactamase family protein [Candidatus Competibacteraceae bacterium]|nr:beta-lactamase family protein [Candidatus Competibacteraceae bacterium]